MQSWLQRPTLTEVAWELDRLMEEVGAGGGYILSSSHDLQPGIPLENVPAVYDTVERRYR